MADWRRYMGNKFAGCQLLAYAHDHCRLRDVRIYLIPGEFDDVGVTDGVDVWIAPVIADPFSVNVARLLADLQAGKPLPKPIPPQAKRERIRIQPVRARVRVET